MTFLHFTLIEEGNLFNESLNDRQDTTQKYFILKKINRVMFMKNCSYDLKDEIRNGFLVTSDRKKIWSVELDLLMEFDRVCNKYGLMYFANGGTLLGAVRHKGFIPWDDDIDLMMLRPDYEKLCNIAKQEFKAPYFFQNIYTDNTMFTISKLRNSNTSAIENFFDNSYNQGIFIDIWPLDDISDGTPISNKISDIKKYLISMITSEKDVIKNINDNKNLPLSKDFIKLYLSLDTKDRIIEYEKFCSNHFGKSSQVSYAFTLTGNKRFDLNWFRDCIMLDFENTKIPAPLYYEKFLTIEYGDWHKFVKGGEDHEVKTFSADIPYKEMLQKIVE